MKTGLKLVFNNWKPVCPKPGINIPGFIVVHMERVLDQGLVCCIVSSFIIRHSWQNAAIYVWIVLMSVCEWMKVVWIIILRVCGFCVMAVSCGVFFSGWDIYWTNMQLFCRMFNFKYYALILCVQCASYFVLFYNLLLARQTAAFCPCCWAWVPCDEGSGRSWRSSTCNALSLWRH